MVKKGDTELQGVTGGYRRLQGVKRGVQGVRRDYRGLKWVAGG